MKVMNVLQSCSRGINLLCENLSSPMGIETSTPRLSWSFTGDHRGVRQSAYQITVATSPDNLANGVADLWDSGRVQSDQSVLVPYSGRKLCSRLRCFWKVRVWDEANHTELSEPSFWEMGLLRPKDWKAQWITADIPEDYRDRKTPAPLFRKAFRVGKPVAYARAYICGLGFYEFYLNGCKVGDAVLHPAFTKYDSRSLYTVHDITGYLKQGDNAAGVMVGTGWYNHRTQDDWNLYAALWRDECKALV